MATSHNTCNTFIDLNGIPYLHAEYLDNTTIQQIDRSAIFSQITVDTSESMRAIIDVNIDDIGTKTSGDMATLGNKSKQKALLKMVSQYSDRLGHKLPTLRKGMIVRVNYQVENAKTGRVIRSAVDDFRINNRQYFLDINSSDVDNNAVVTCFCDTEVSTLSEFTHGFEPMNLRITNIQLYYEAVQDDIKTPRCQQTLFGHHDCQPNNECINMNPYTSSNRVELDNYYMHKNMQNIHYIGEPDPRNYYGARDVSMIANPSWSLINRFYHFENDGKNIIIHGQEVYNNRTKVVLIPCGVVRVNRLFTINPAHRLIFKFCIWKNDLTVVNDTTAIGKALKAPYQDMDIDMTDTDTAFNTPIPHFINPDDETIVRQFEKLRQTDIDQNYNINQLIDITSSMVSTIKDLQETVGTMQESINAVLDRLDMKQDEEDDKSPAIDTIDPLNPESPDETDNTSEDDKSKDDSSTSSESEGELGSTDESSLDENSEASD
jgi:hypothetical protein